MATSAIAGPDTRGVVEQLVARDAVGVVGNHDVWLRAWARREGFDSFALKPIMGGRATLDSYGVRGRTPREIEAEAWRVPVEHRDWLDRLVVAIDLQVCGQKFWVVHAPFTLSEAERRAPDAVVPWLAEHDPGRLIDGNCRLGEMVAVDRTVIVGHEPRARAFDTGHVIALDTGAGMLGPGVLTAVILPERRFIALCNLG